MKGFFKKKEKVKQTDTELELINLDETAGWSKLEVAHKLRRQEAVERGEEAIVRREESRQTDMEMAGELCPEVLAEEMTREAEDRESGEESGE